VPCTGRSGTISFQLEIAEVSVFIQNWFFGVGKSKTGFWFRFSVLISVQLHNSQGMCPAVILFENIDKVPLIEDIVFIFAVFKIPDGSLTASQPIFIRTTLPCSHW